MEVYALGFEVTAYAVEIIVTLAIFGLRDTSKRPSGKAVKVL